MQKIILIGLFFFSPFVFAKNKSDCRDYELEQKHCRLQFGSYVLDFNPEKILINDGAWRNIENLPLTGKRTQWERVQWKRANKRLLLQLYIWGEPHKEAQIQDLHWIVMEIERTDLTKHIDEIVQKRTPVKAEETNTPKYIADKPEKHGLKASGKKSIRWWAGLKSGQF